MLINKEDLKYEIYSKLGLDYVIFDYDSTSLQDIIMINYIQNIKPNFTDHHIKILLELLNSNFEKGVDKIIVLDEVKDLITLDNINDISKVNMIIRDQRIKEV